MLYEKLFKYKSLVEEIREARKSKEASEKVEEKRKGYYLLESNTKLK